MLQDSLRNERVAEYVDNYAGGGRIVLEPSIVAELVEISFGQFAG
jgi:hypothetical protein